MFSNEKDTQEEQKSIKPYWKGPLNMAGKRGQIGPLIAISPIQISGYVMANKLHEMALHTRAQYSKIMLIG